jgi:F5/8 type C domain-containing protein
MSSFRTRRRDVCLRTGRCVLFVFVAASSLALLASAGQAGSRTPAALACPTPPATPPLPTIPVKRVLGSGHLGQIVRTPTGFVVPDLAIGTIWRFSRNGVKLGAINVPRDDLQHGLAIDGLGNLYVGRYPWQLVKYSRRGALLWTRPSSFPLVAVFALGHGTQQKVGLTNWKNSSVQMYKLDGRQSTSLSLAGSLFAATPAGGVAATDDGRYVRLYDARGRQTRLFGDRHRDNDPLPMGAPAHFYQLGGVAQLKDGRLLVTDTRAGIMLFSRSGLLLGAVEPTDVDPKGLSERSGILVSGGSVYVETGPQWTSNQSLVRLPLKAVLAHASHGRPDDPRLGLGAGLTMTDTDLYVRGGAPIRVRASFDAWWRRLAPRMSLCWTLRSTDQLRHHTRAKRRILPVARVASHESGINLSVPRHLAPGAYQIDASLLQSGKAVSHTSLVFTVAARWMPLDFNTLPAGTGWGGPSPARGVALASQLGTGAFRAQLDWRRLLGHGLNAPLDLSVDLPQLQAAAAEAARSGSTLIVQVGEGGPEKQLVTAGTWEARVRELVTALKPYVHVWEAWNEPNATFGSPSDYVAKVLEPFARAVRQTDPGATVVGGSTVGVDLGYWRGIAGAGGLKSLDIAAVHPYTGHNRSWEENGTVEQLRALRDLLDRSGAKVPIWNTEQAWWSDGAANLLGQADNSARAVVWMHALGIAKWAYFIPEGGWGNNGVSFSAIQVNDHVKPVALAIMTAEHELAGRPFLGQVPLGLDSAYALRFGKRAGDPQSSELLVAWTDGLRLPTVISGRSHGRVTVTSEIGASTTRNFSGRKTLTLDGDPVYVSLARGAGSLAIRPREAFGEDLALAAAGASASASSATASNPPRGAIDGINGANGGGDIPGLPMWASAPGDRHRSLTVTLRAPREVDRVLVSTHSIGSIAPGVRNYDVQVRRSSSRAWQTVAVVRRQFYYRQRLITFSPRMVGQIRVVVHSVNFGGSDNNGLRPPYWPTDKKELTNPRSPWYGPAIIEELAAYAPRARR